MLADNCLAACICNLCFSLPWGRPGGGSAGCVEGYAEGDDFTLLPRWM